MNDAACPDTMRSYPRKLAAVAAVALLHVGMIAAFIFAMQRPATIAGSHFVEILVRVPARVMTPPAEVQGVPRTIFAPKIAAPEIDIAPQAPAASAVTGVGHALFGCDIDSLAALPPEERTGCLRLPLGHPQEPSLRLGPYDENSPFAQVIAKRNAPFVPMEHACAPNEGPTANLGLPCFGFPTGTIGNLVGGTK